MERHGKIASIYRAFLRGSIKFIWAGTICL